MTRRRMVGATLAVGVAVPIGVARQAWAASTASGPVQLTLPVPTGPYPVGTVPLRLVDTSRTDPVVGPGHHRELLAGVWYPARGVRRYPPVRWTSPAVLRALLTSGASRPTWRWRHSRIRGCAAGTNKKRVQSS